MKVHEESHRLPYTAVQMFDFVVNVERYPEFLPGYLWAGIRGRSGDTLYVDQAVGFRGIRWRFGSVATINRPERITIRSMDSPFRCLEIDWRFTTLPAGCHVAFRLTYEFNSRILDTVIGGWFDAIAERIVTAFLEQAHRVYGTPFCREITSP